MTNQPVSDSLPLQSQTADGQAADEQPAGQSTEIETEKKQPLQDGGQKEEQAEPAASSTEASGPAATAPGPAASATTAPDATAPGPAALELTVPKPLRRTSTASSSKLHDVIQDIISQFDPLKTTSASTPHLTTQQQQQEQQQQPEQSTSTAAGLLQTQQSAQTAKQTSGYPDMRSNFEAEPDGFNYSEFLQQLRHPAAKPVARTVKSFLTEFGRRPMTLAEQVRFVHDFLDFIGNRMRECEVWSSMDERSLDNAREGMEKLVMNRLYPLCFSPSTSDDADKDHVLREKMGLFRWIREEHLDVPKSPQNAGFLQFAREELLKMNNFNSPRDKVICILNCCTIIYGLLKNMRGAQSPDVGADRFLPLLIYVVITACPPKLVSNVQYITRFRSPERMQSEAGYYVTNLQGAIAFIESMDASCLSISQEEFDKNIEMTIWEMELERRTRERSLAQQQQLQQQQQQQQQLQQQRTGHLRSGSAQQDMPGERAQWLIDRSSDLAKTTLEKTNNFVGRLISEFSTPSASESGRSTPHVAREGSSRARYPGEPGAVAIAAASANPSESSAAVDSPDVAADLAAADSQLAMGGPEWVATLSLVRDMFPNIDRDVVDIIFEANAGVVARTIEQLLDISSDNEVLATATVMAEKSRDESEELIKEILLADAAEAEAEAAATATEQHEQHGRVEQTGRENVDAVEEMEKWKGRWADDSDDSDLESELDEAPAPAAASVSENASVNATAAVQGAGSSSSAGIVETQKSEESGKAPTSKVDTHGPPTSSGSASAGKVAADAAIRQPQLAPDTSGDEEYARRLQEEFERQANVAE